MPLNSPRGSTLQWSAGDVAVLGTVLVSNDAIAELAADSRSMIQSVSSRYKPSRQSVRNDSTVPNGYKRADRIQFGKSIIQSSFIA